MTKKVTHRNVGPPWSQASASTITELTLESCRRDPDRPLMIFEDGCVVTRGIFLDRVERFAGYLHGRLAPGDRVAIMLGNRAEFMIAWLAVVAVRGTQVSVNPSLGEHDAAHVFRDSGSVMAILGEESRELIERIRPQCPQLEEILYVGEPEPDGLMAYCRDVKPLPLVDAAARRDDIINIFYTSGTTGPPKGCMVDHEWWLRAIDVDLRLDPKGPDDRLLCCLQFFYNDAPLMLLMSLLSGGTMVVMRRFSVSRFWDVIRKNDVTRILGIASIPTLLLKAPPNPSDRDHKVRLAIQVAVPPHLHKQLNERWGFPWVENYGITEGGILARVPVERAAEMAGTGSCGVRAPEVSLRIVDTQDQDVPMGSVGEIIVQAPGMMRGYLNRPEATAEVMRGGWFHTGDLAREDDRGFLYFVGRKKDIIRRSGENVSAVEVEDLLRSHPKIVEAAVIPVPDELRGEEIKAYILPVEGESAETIPPEEIVKFCSGKIAKYKVPRYIEYRTSDFSRTPSMRVKKEDLRNERDDLITGVWDREQVGP